MDDVKDIIKRRRESLGLTLEDVAAKVNVNASTVMRWETGRIENMKRDKISIFGRGSEDKSCCYNGVGKSS